jgi:DNA-binding transcriptional LysR family regulator
MFELSPPDLTPRQLQTILVVAEYNSFIAAAAAMKTSQPAITRTVKHVENVLGVKLFDRTTRTVQTTAAGREFVGVTQRMLNDLRITIRSMKELTDQRRGQIIISSIMSVAHGRLADLMSAYHRDHPGIELHVREGVHGTVIEDVRSGVADFGITYLDGLPGQFAAVALAQEEFVLILPRNHPIAGNKSVALSALGKVPLVSLPRDSRTRQSIDGAAASIRLTLHHVATVGQFATMLAFVRAGIGLAIAPRGGIAGLLGRELSAVPLRGRPLTHNLGIVTSKGREATPATMAMIAMIRRCWPK